MANLTELFDSLQPPVHSAEDTTRFSAIPIPGHIRHRIAKDAQGKPSLLLSVAGPSKDDKSAPIKLEHIFVQHDINCQISQADGIVEEGRFTIVGCAVNDETLHTYFLHIASIILASLEVESSRSKIFHTVNNLVELFRRITEIPRKSVQGVWAELFLITKASDVVLMVQAWHSNNEDHYDFNAENQRIEVKSTSRRNRQHYFSLEQLSPPRNTTLIIASIFVEYAGIGTSIMDLVDQITPHLMKHPDLLLKIDQLISSTLGTNWRDAYDAQFDMELAEESLKFFEASVIPTVHQSIPPEVSDVRFKSDLANCTTADIQNLGKQGGLFKAIFDQAAVKTTKHKYLKSNT